MIEPTIVFTHYALLLTATTSMMVGVVMGWALTRHQKRTEINTLQGKLKNLQIEQAGKTIPASAAKHTITPAAAKMSALNKKKDRLLKDFMKRQLQQKKSLDKATAELKQLRKAKLLADRSLNAAHISLDQWKEKCAALAEAQTKLKQSVQSATTSNVSEKVSAAVQLPVINITAAQKTSSTKSSAPVVTISQNNRKITRQHTTQNATEVTTHPVDESLVNEVLSPARDGQKATETRTAKRKQGITAKATQTKLTSINGIGPAIEKELRKLGIQSVEQLATLKQKEVNAIDKDLGKYSGRITRQEWVKQAKALIKTLQRENAAA